MTRRAARLRIRLDFQIRCPTEIAHNNMKKHVYHILARHWSSIWTLGYSYSTQVTLGSVMAVELVTSTCRLYKNRNTLGSLLDTFTASSARSYSIWILESRCKDAQAIGGRMLHGVLGRETALRDNIGVML